MANTLPDVVVAANVWTNLYSATGITVGTALDIWNKGPYQADIAIKATTPANGVGVPLYTGPLGSYLSIDAGESGVWALSIAGTRLCVQAA